MDGQVDYSGYDEEQLLEVFHNMRRAKYPLNFARIQARLESLGYRLVETPEGERLIAPAEAAVRIAVLKSAKSGPRRLVHARHRRTAWILFFVALLFLTNGIYQLETTSGDWGPIAALFWNVVAEVLIGATGVVYFVAAYREGPRSWVDVFRFLAGIALWLAITLAVVYTYHAIKELFN